VLKDVLHVPELRKSESMIGAITSDRAPEKPRGCAKVIDVEARGEGNIKGNDKRTKATDMNGVIRVNN
jgi:hypothetical protein